MEKTQIKLYPTPETHARSLSKRAYLEGCAKIIKVNPKMRFPRSVVNKLLYTEAENMRRIYFKWIEDYIKCRTNTPPNSMKLGRYFGLDDATTYRILNYLRYKEDNDITYDYLKMLNFIKD